MKKTALGLMLIVFAFVGSTQPKILAENKFYGHVKMCIELSYTTNDSTGLIDTTVVSNLGFNKRLSFNEAGQVTQYDIYRTKEGRFDTFRINIYNDKGQRTIEDLPMLKKKVLYFYDDNDHLLKKHELDKNNNIKKYSKYDYDEKSKIYSESIYGFKTDSLLKKREFLLDSLGEEQDVMSVYMNSSTLTTQKTDPTEQLTESENMQERGKSNYNSNFEPRKEEVVTYKFDQTGNWIEKLTVTTSHQKIGTDKYHTKQRSFWTIRTIEYYTN